MTRVSIGRLPVTRRLAMAALIFLGVYCLGVVGFVVLEGASTGDALYFTTITVFAVGFREVVELDASGRFLTSAVIVMGVGSFTFLTVNIIEFLVEGHLLDIVGRRRMQRKLDELDAHMIVCGFGRVGRQVADDLRASHTPFVVIDVDENRLQEHAAGQDIAYLHGNATDERVLEAAGIRRAHGLAACTDDDAENVLIVLTAKMVRHDLFVVTRLKSSLNATKAQQAGANRVILPTEIGGHRIAALLTKPSVVDFLDVVTRGSGVDLVLEEVVVHEGSPVLGSSLASAGVRDSYSVNVVAIRHAGETRAHPHPDPNKPLVAGDVMVVIGSREDLDRLMGDA